MAALQGAGLSLLHGRVLTDCACAWPQIDHLPYFHTLFLALFAQRQLNCVVSVSYTAECYGLRVCVARKATTFRYFHTISALAIA